MTLCGVRSTTTAVLLLICTLSLATPAGAQGGVKVGTLTCGESGSVGLILGSAKGLNCRFSGPNGDEHYVGTLSKIGVDIGFTAGGRIVWEVLAPTGVLGPGSLAGTYVGATASATIVVGVGANALIGGSGNTVALQPLSIEGNRGLNVAGGIGAITLAWRPGPRPAGFLPPSGYPHPAGADPYVAGPAYAPRPAGFMQACLQERQQFCGAIAPGGGRIIQCLRQHIAQASPGCGESLQGTARPAALPASAQPPAMPSPGTTPGFLKACAAERQQFCAGVSIGGGRVVECLQPHMTQLSLGCGNALQVMQAPRQNRAPSASPPTAQQ